MKMFFGPIFTIIAGLAILIFPRLLSYIVAFYLLIVGIIQLVDLMS